MLLQRVKSAQVWRALTWDPGHGALLGSWAPSCQLERGGQEASHLGFGSEAEAEAWPLRLFRDLWNLLTAAWRRFERQVEEGGS